MPQQRSLILPFLVLHFLVLLLLGACGSAGTPAQDAGMDGQTPAALRDSAPAADGRSFDVPRDAGHDVFEEDVPGSDADWPTEPSLTLRASDDGRHLEYTGTSVPFLYVADTSWLAPNRLDQDDILTLLNDRDEKGFTVIQVSVLPFSHFGEFDNIYGAEPVDGRDLASPIEVGTRTSNENHEDYDYWDHVDFLIEAAASRNMQIALVPSWYGYEGEDWRGWVNESSAAAYGEFLGGRLGHHPNILWLLGGDNDPVGGVRAVPSGGSTADVLEATRAMAEAIARTEPMAHLMSYHARRGTSSLEYFPADEWHTLASAYADATTWDEVAEASGHGRPVVMVESYYDHREYEPFLDERALRAQGWWALLSGAGYAYGSEAIWDLEPGQRDRGAPGEWQDYLDAPSARQVGVMATALREQVLLPNSEVVPSPGDGEGRIVAATSGARTWIYLPHAGSLRVNGDALSGPHVVAHWLDPRDGSTTEEVERELSDSMDFEAPGWPDAVLVLRVAP